MAVLATTASRSCLRFVRPNSDLILVSLAQFLVIVVRLPLVTITLLVGVHDVPPPFCRDPAFYICHLADTLNQ